MLFPNPAASWQEVAELGLARDVVATPSLAADEGFPRNKACTKSVRGD